jgi:NAD(P)H-hydrate epimerase
MDVLTANRMREIDRQAIEEYGIPGVVLMENAGLQVVKAIRETEAKHLVIVAGPGNNGGDGFVVARHLYQEKHVSVWITAASENYRGDALINYRILQKLGVPCRDLREEGAISALQAELSHTQLVVDSMLGTGITRDVDSLYKQVIHTINNSGVPVIAVDIPSGVCADSGKILGTAIRATFTVTFALPKRGLLLFPGATCTGQLIVADIGIPPALLRGSDTELITAQLARRLLPQRPSDAHKGTFGSLLLVAGSLGMSGAVVLSARAALRGGCGLIYAATPRSVQPTVAAQVAEAITVPLPENKMGRVLADSLYILREKWRNCQAVAVGPGMTQDEESLPVLAGILRECSLPVVLDADALNQLAKHPNLMDQRVAPAILTPHPGEAARLLDASVEEIQSDRLASVQAIAKRYRSIVVLKGAHTLIADPLGHVAFNITGNCGMATAGSGDVLTGIIAAMLAQGLTAFDAARLGVYLHGLAGDLAAQKVGETSLIAGDVTDHISDAYLELKKIHM